MRDLVTIDRTIAAQVAHEFALDTPHKMRPGNFREALLTAFARADQHNFERLARAFPEIGTAIWLVKNVAGGSARVVEVAASGQSLTLTFLDGARRLR